MRKFTQEDAYYLKNNPNTLVNLLNSLGAYLGNRTFAVDTNDTKCKVTGVNSVRGASAAVDVVTSDGDVTASGDYTGTSDAVYTFEVVTACTTPGTITGMTFKWKKGSGAYSAPVAATGSAQLIEAGVSIAFAVSAAKDFVIGDKWTVTCTTSKVTIATGDYLMNLYKETLPAVVVGIPVINGDRVYIDDHNVVKTAQAYPTSYTALATIAVSGAGVVTVTDVRKFAV